MQTHLDPGRPISGGHQQRGVNPSRAEAAAAFTPGVGPLPPQPHSVSPAFILPFPAQAAGLSPSDSRTRSRGPHVHRIHFHHLPPPGTRGPPGPGWEPFLQPVQLPGRSQPKHLHTFPSIRFRTSPPAPPSPPHLPSNQRNPTPLDPPLPPEPRPTHRLPAEPPPPPLHPATSAGHPVIPPELQPTLLSRLQELPLNTTSRTSFSMNLIPTTSSGASRHSGRVGCSPPRQEDRER